MTPKEKAQDLVDLYSFANFREIKFAHNCALIAVDEIINETLELDRLRYWNEVKNEIKKTN